MLKSVRKPDGSIVSFEYDALGRRTSKTFGENIKRFLWDGNILLHEWDYDKKDKSRAYLNDLGELIKDEIEPINNLVTWIYDNNSYNPSAKILENETYSIVNDYLGTPIQAYNESGTLVWERELDIYGKIRKIDGDKNLIPFLYQGQIWDEDIELAYNRFRMYSTEMGMYISQDPIGIKGCFNVYAYVFDTNKWIDPLGLVPWERGGFNEWFNNASPQDILDNKKSVEAALRAPGGKHEMFPVSIASKAKELGFTAEEIKSMSVDTKKITFVDVPDGAGNLLEGKHHSSSASSIFHNNLIEDLNGAKTKQDALDIIKKHHDAHMKISCP